MAEIWMLRRGDREPMVWPFDTFDQAEDFALDHGMTNWRAERIDNPKKEHEPICACCRERWPCRHQRLDHQAQSIIAAGRNRCHRCSKQVGWLRVEFPGAGELGEDLLFHGKLGACFTAAKKLAKETENEKALKDIERCEQQREYSRDLRRRSRERREHEARMLLADRAS